jgi:predicted enzyme related to lactoylglutathione lyase
VSSPDIGARAVVAARGKAHNGGPMPTRHLPFVVLELEADDLRRASTFYERALGWSFTQSAAEHGALEAEMLQDHDTMVRVHLRRRGAAVPQRAGTGRDDEAGKLFVCVPDLAQVVEQVAQAGGRLLDAPEHIPGLGRRVRFLDTEGNQVAVLEPLH